MREGYLIFKQAQATLPVQNGSARNNLEFNAGMGISLIIKTSPNYTMRPKEKRVALDLSKTDLKKYMNSVDNAIKKSFTANRKALDYLSTR